MGQNDKGEEFLAPPEPRYIAGMPERASPVQQRKLSAEVDRGRLFDMLRPRPSIALAAARFTEGCIGGGAYPNNCAHYLSNAFILAGYTELMTNSMQIRAKCSGPECRPPQREGRPIRARNMNEWFKAKAGRRQKVFPKGSEDQFKREMRSTGFWAVFELDEQAFWGGHVCIVDTDSWNVYGTGMHGYWDWAQYCYQW